MPRLTHSTTNFTSGELSPRLIGRTDTPRYASSAARMENVICLVEGGFRRRDGLLYVANAKNANKQARLIPFIYSVSEAYILEVGDLYIRFYKDGARLGAPYEVTTTITESMLFDLDFAQGADTMFLTHASMAPKRLRRFADENWQIDDVPFDPAPFDEIGHSFTATITLSAATTGAGRTATASSAIWLNGDVGREIVFRGGVFLVTSFTSTTVLVGTITSAFESVNIAADVWTLQGSPQETVTPSVATPVETAGVTFTSAALNIWRSTDVGKYLRINGGLVLLTGFTSATVVTGTIKQVLAGVIAAPKNSWSLEAAVWSAANGYPKACALFQQRLCLAGTTAFPQTIWGSSTGSYIDFTLGTFDADGFSYTLNSGQDRSIIQRMVGASRVLHALSYGGEHTLRGGVEKPITPTNVQADYQTSYGSSVVRPLRIGKDIAFVQRAGLKLRGIIYDASEDDFDADDLTQLASHVTGQGIVDMTYHQEPEPLLYACRQDGEVATLAYSRKAEVLAWTRQVTEGVVESVATIPVDGGDQTWALVARTVGGATVRYVERFEPGCWLDSAVVRSSLEAPIAMWSVAHLPGVVVDCVADGAYMGTFTVTGGQITLPRTAEVVQIGLPYAWTVDMLTPEIGTGEGSAQGHNMSTSKVTIRMLDTYALRLNGDELAFQSFGSGLLDQAPAPFTGIKTEAAMGWGAGENDLTLSGVLPFPAHVLSVHRVFTVNSG